MKLLLLRAKLACTVVHTTEYLATSVLRGCCDDQVPGNPAGDFWRQIEATQAGLPPQEQDS
eukprot:431692-Amphidinium_carterae.1